MIEQVSPSYATSISPRSLTGNVIIINELLLFTWRHQQGTVSFKRKLNLRKTLQIHVEGFDSSAKHKTKQLLY